MMGTPMKNSVGIHNLTDMSIVLLNTAHIKPVWGVAVNYVKKGKYTDLTTGRITTCDFMSFIGQTHGYYENDSIQMIELRTYGGKMMMGIIICNEDEDMPILDDKKIHEYIQNIKPTILDELRIPIFKTQTKLRYTNILKQTELKTVFSTLDIPEFIDDDCNIDDVIQNIEVDINPNFKLSSKEKNKGYKTVKKFVANRTFIYYFRYTPLNMIFTLGIHK